MNFDKPYVKYFLKGKIRLKKLLMFEPDLIGEIEIGKDSKAIVFGINPKSTERQREEEESVSVSNYNPNMSNKSIETDNVIKSASSKYNHSQKALLKSNNYKKPILNMGLKKNNNTSSNMTNSNKSFQSGQTNDNRKMINSRSQKSSIIQIRANRLTEIENENIEYNSNSQVGNIAEFYNDKDSKRNDSHVYYKKKEYKDIISNSKHKLNENNLILAKSNSTKPNIPHMKAFDKYIKQDNNNLKTNQQNITNHNLAHNINEEKDELSLLRKEQKEIVFRFQLTENEYRYYLQEKAKMVLK